MQENEIRTEGLSDTDNQDKQEILVKRRVLEQLIPEHNPSGKKDLSFLLETDLPVRVELGHFRMKIKDILNLGQGSIVQLDKLPEEPVRIFIGERLLGQGEIVIIGEKLGVRITEIAYTPEEKED
jgi:flagellar motor switch protein FliN/FliY